MRLPLAACLAAGLALTAAPASAACDPGETEIRFALVESLGGNSKGEAAAALADAVNRDLDGRACMTVEAETTRFTEATALDALRAGDVHMTAVGTGALTPVSARFQIFDLPFLFDDVQSVLAFEASVTGRKLLSLPAAEGVTGLAFLLDGFKQMTADRPIVAPEDVAGLAFRVSGAEVESAYFRLLDADPVDMPMSELRAALETGRLNGQNASWSTIRSQDLDDVQEGFTATRHAVVMNMLLVDAAFWEGLDPALRSELELLVKLVSHERNRLAFELNQAARYAMAQSGTRIVDLDVEQRLAWKRAMQDVWFSFGGNIGFDQISTALHANRFN